MKPDDVSEPKELVTRVIEREDVPATSSALTGESPVGDGYDVQVKVVDANKDPVVGAKVTIHSKVQEAITDKEGIVKFSQVERGEHMIDIAYDGYRGEQKVDVSGDVKEIHYTIQVEPRNMTPVFMMIALLVFVIAILVYVILRMKGKLVRK